MLLGSWAVMVEIESLQSRRRSSILKCPGQISLGILPSILDIMLRSWNSLEWMREAKFNKMARNTLNRGRQKKRRREISGVMRESFNV